jgi:uncharacterized protein YuzE
MCQYQEPTRFRYFQDTDTLHIEFKSAEVAETRDLDENTLLDVDKTGRILGIPVEHASQRTDVPRFSYEQVIA